VRYELCFYIPGDGILHSHRRENLKPYILPPLQLACLLPDPFPFIYLSAVGAYGPLAADPRGTRQGARWSVSVLALRVRRCLHRPRSLLKHKPDIAIYGGAISRELFDILFGRVIRPLPEYVLHDCSRGSPATRITPPRGRGAAHTERTSGFKDCALRYYGIRSSGRAFLQ
jgi:hypothetical protein